MRAPARRTSSVTAMLEPRSIAVVGASARPGSFGRQMILTLLQGGYQGAVYPVNPRYEEIEGLACYSTLADVPGRPDLALLGVSNAQLEEQVQAAAAAGASAAAIFASGYEEPLPGRPLLTNRVADIARDARMALCGGNCMGFLNLQESVWACGFPMPPQLQAGAITFISHSGSAFSAMLHNDLRLHFNLVVSSGQELVTSSADYLDYAANHDSTRVIAMFLETIRAPVEFGRGLKRAAERDIPVVILKVGRTRMSK
ncbi:MAG: CoA-binding protein, partial [Actinobacteria bacterium]|nr:CoA-binding protein [Actinomycetota bacterium]